MMDRATPTTPPRLRARRGSVLVVTMWVTLALAGLVLVLSRAMRVEMLRSANATAEARADAALRGAVQYAMAHVDGLAGAMPTETDMPSEAVAVGEEYFWLLRPVAEDESGFSLGTGEIAYGLEAEAAKVNLNTADLDTLLTLPGMTAEIAAAIVDWRDPDSEVTADGAESEHYLLLAEPYEPKNGPFETIEELLLVRGITPEVLYGEDANRNGALDANEDDADESAPADDRDGQLNRGLAAHLTVWSAEPNTDADGGERVNVNEAGIDQLAELLQDVVPDDRLPEVLVAARRNRPFSSPIDFHFRCELEIEEFREIADRITTSGDDVRRGLINVNAAPAEVLACLPGLEDADVSALLAWRASPEDDSSLDSIAWVAEALPQEKAVGIGDRITTRSYQFSGNIVAASGDGRAFRRCRIVLDALEGAPRLVYRQDLTHLGWPLDGQILEDLRAGLVFEAAQVLTIGSN